MHGGMKIYAGAPAAARQYMEADRGGADDHYLTEGAGLARRFSVTEGRVTELAPLTGDSYETWVAGRDPGTGEPRGQLRGDGHAVRFVEVVVNGPKTWSLAAALHPGIAAAYDAAQARAAEQIIGWLGQHATTRVGPRGGQLQVPVEGVEAVTVAHDTSRAGDPHRHLHLQINARVFAVLQTEGRRPTLARRTDRRNGDGRLRRSSRRPHDLRRVRRAVAGDAGRPPHHPPGLRAGPAAQRLPAAGHPPSCVDPTERDPRSRRLALRRRRRTTRSPRERCASRSASPPPCSSRPSEIAGWSPIRASAYGCPRCTRPGCSRC